MTKPTKTKIVHRSSVSGRFVTEEYADSHKRITERERIKVSKPSKN